MISNEKHEACLKFLRGLKKKSKQYVGFDESLNTLQEVAATIGLEDEDIDMLINVITHGDLGATRLVSLVKCIIPRYKMPKEAVSTMIRWCLAMNELPVTVSTITLQWIIGLWDYQLIDRQIINVYYDVLFYVMQKKERLERHIARLIYVLTKPEDVTRNNVSRLLALHQKYSKPQKHIIALLSLFKSYKPELVPEKIQSMNIESVWKPIPEVLRIRLKNARDRADIQQIRSTESECFNWNTLEVGKTRKKGKSLLPSVGYFQIGSSIFVEKNTKSIFDVYNTEQLGKSHLSIELPCNAVSLLSNTAGYHLLTYADFNYQSRFSYNLYNTLMRAFILEEGKFSTEEMDKLLNMTIEFCQYMQQGILVINLFLDDYLHYSAGEYQLKLLSLLQWMISVSITDLQERVLIHVRNMFYESSLNMKCEIIKTFKVLIRNLFVNQGFEECCQNEPSPFLGQAPLDSLEDILPVLRKICEGLIGTGLNVHSYDVLLLSEALSFYEEISTLEHRSNILSLTLAPPAVIYGGFVSPSCSILSRICKLLLRYRDRSLLLKERKQQNLLKNQMYAIAVYAEDVATALWYNEPFTKRTDAYFLKDIPDKVVEDLGDCGLDFQLNINNHYSILPFKFTLNEAGLNISTKEDAINVALHYYPSIKEFLSIFQT